MDKLTKAEKKEIRKQERQEWEQKLDKEEQIRIYKKIGIWIFITIAGVLLIWGIIALINSPSQTTATLKQPPLTSSDISTGPSNAKVTLVEYADFQCPTCGLYHPILKKLLQDFQGKIRFVYRFFPLPTLHQNAIPASKAAYAAYLQGKFWEMHDMLFENQKDWATNTDAKTIFQSYARALGLDINKFNTDYEADSTQKFIDNEENAGTIAGVMGTPTFFLNGKNITNPQGYEPFKQIIQDNLKK